LDDGDSRRRQATSLNGATMLPTTFLRLRFLGLLTLLLAGVGLQAAPVPGYLPFAVEGGFYRVELIRWERFGPAYAAVRFRFRLLDERNGKERFFDVENATTSLERGEIAGDKLVLIGDVQGLARGLTVVDLDRGRIEDFVLSYGGGLSPDGRTLAFIEFYPRHSTPQVSSDQVLAVDLGQDPSDGGGRERHAIYPPHAGTEDRLADVLYESPGQRHRLQQQAGFLWLDEPRRLVFLDAVAGSTWLVEVDLSLGLSAPQVSRRLVDVSKILKPSPESEGYQRLLDQESAALSAVGLRQQENKVVIELSRQRYRDGVFRVTHVTLLLPSFEPDGDYLGDQAPSPGDPSRRTQPDWVEPVMTPGHPSRRVTASSDELRAYLGAHPEAFDSPVAVLRKQPPGS